MKKIFLPCTRYPVPTVTALGFFDGVHIAHAALLKETVALAKRQGAVPALFTFAQTPRRAESKLLSLESRLLQFEKHGIEVAFVANFDALCSLSPDAFVRDVLQAVCHANAAVCGYNFRFGKNAAGDAEKLLQLLPQSLVLPPVLHDGETVSSSRIRRLIENGEVEKAAELLGAPYTLSAPVTHGKALGRTLGFPTANMQPHELMPKSGVYETRVSFDGKEFVGLTDIGTRPTVEGDGECRMETHIPDFSGDLYGKTVSVTFLRRLRGELCFSSVDELKAQLQKDISLVMHGDKP